MRRLFTGIFLCLMLTSCSMLMNRYRIVELGPTPYQLEAFNKQDIIDVVAYTVQELQMGRFEGNYSITLTDQWIVLQQWDGTYIVADGLTVPKDKHIFVFPYQSCLADSALIHEIAHTMGFKHEDKAAEMAIEEVQHNAIKDLCPPDYKRRERPDPTLMTILK